MYEEVTHTHKKRTQFTTWERKGKCLATLVNGLENLVHPYDKRKRTLKKKRTLFTTWDRKGNALRQL